MRSQGVDMFSFVPVCVEPYFRYTCLGNATGFLWLRPDGKLALITNWHVVSGRNNETGKCLHDQAGIPDNLRVYFPSMDLANLPRIITILTVDADEEPLWTQHPSHGAAVDVVALPIQLSASEIAPIVPINTLLFSPLKQRIGMPVFILGYPFGRMGIGMPIWKQGSFASEPFLTPDFDHRFLIIDTASRPGMSGSPVIQRNHGLVEFENGESGRIQNGDGAGRFVGIYSGRFHTNEVADAQLGRVWPEKFITEIIDHMIKSEVDD
jgi:Trypsin-like peptidase domain